MPARRLETVCAALVALLLVSGAVSAAALSGRAQPTRSAASAAGSERLGTETLATTTTIVTDDFPTVVTSSTVASTSTTRPRPVVTPSAVPRPAPRPAPPPTPTTDPPAPPADPAPARCEAARVWAIGAGLSVPAGWGFRCPDPARDEKGGEHWGIACWNCDGGSYVGVNIALIGSSDATLRYVVAHETCHAIEFVTLGLSTEITADLCALLHGAPRA